MFHHFSWKWRCMGSASTGIANWGFPARQQPIKLLLGGPGIVFKGTFKSQYGKLCKIWCVGSPIKSFNGNSGPVLEKVSGAAYTSIKSSAPVRHHSQSECTGSYSPKPHPELLGCCFLWRSLWCQVTVHTAGNIDITITDHFFLPFLHVRPSEARWVG